MSETDKPNWNQIAERTLPAEAQAAERLELAWDKLGAAVLYTAHVLNRFDADLANDFTRCMIRAFRS